VTQIGDTPHLEKLIGPIKVMLDAYQDGRLDAVYLCYTKFINTMKPGTGGRAAAPAAGQGTEGGQAGITSGTTSTSRTRRW
jgi:F-type H+-transporting ATPase subunit gamma